MLRLRPLLLHTEQIYHDTSESTINLCRISLQFNKKKLFWTNETPRFLPLTLLGTHTPFLFLSLKICLQKASEISRFIVLLFAQFPNAFHLELLPFPVVGSVIYLSVPSVSSSPIYLLFIRKVCAGGGDNQKVISRIIIAKTVTNEP